MGSHRPEPRRDSYAVDEKNVPVVFWNAGLANDKRPNGERDNEKCKIKNDH
jgi:hypothetical protein